MHSIRSDIEPIDPSLVPFIISTIDTLTYAAVAGLTLLVYDSITTMDKEIKYFWSSPCKFVSLIYFVNRYLGILGAVSGVVDWTTILLIDCSNISLPTNHLPLIAYTDILLMRVMALYHQDKNITTCLTAIFGLEAAFGLGALIYTIIYGEISLLRLAEGVTVCFINRSPQKIWSAIPWAVTLLYAIILMVLALRNAAQHWRESAGLSQSNLLTVLIRDQAIYFILVIFCSVMGIVADQLFIPNILLANLLTVLGNPRLLCVLGSHLLVHLKEAGERRSNGGTSYRMRTMSSMQFC
ncbi:hypothetical protein DFH11DRAFT_1515672 [Phellopilus nigrolimitatus]|nr:hypothetical protein DFH11DRAFT_1515672 [Phellopilus nigrolimitatus]